MLLFSKQSTVHDGKHLTFPLMDGSLILSFLNV